MKFSLLLILVPVLSGSCKKKVETIHPTRESITESVYASGTIKSKNQYQVFTTVNGLIRDIYVKEGDTVRKGAPLFSILNESTRLNRENAQLAAELADFNANAGKLNDLSNQIELARSKMINDSVLWQRQSELWSQNIGSKNDLEKAILNFQNSRTNFESARIRYADEKRRIEINSRQAIKNLQISRSNERDYTITSDIHGRVYTVMKERGELVTPQMPLAVIGDANDFILELQVDEYDITRIQTGQTVVVTMDSYKGELFEAKVTRIYPIMNERTKTFTVEAEFSKAPPSLYPNLTLEANIVIQVKENALTIPRNYLGSDRYVIRENGDTIPVKVGLKDYLKAEILEGVNEKEILIRVN